MLMILSSFLPSSGNLDKDFGSEWNQLVKLDYRSNKNQLCVPYQHTEI